MKTTQLHSIIADLNHLIYRELIDGGGVTPHLSSRSSYPDGTPTRKDRRQCFNGLLRSNTASCENLEQHITLKKADSPTIANVAVGWVLDANANQLDADLPVVAAMGINYGQGHDYLNHSVNWTEDTKMRGKLVRAAAMDVANSSGTCTISPLRKDFHLLVGNFFPWITTSSWETHKFNRIEEQMLIQCFGFSDPLASLKLLLSGVIQEHVTHIFFHGVNSTVSRLGIEFISQSPSLILRPNGSTEIQVVFCDNLARPSLPVRNSVGLCLERTGKPEEVMNLEE